MNRGFLALTIPLVLVLAGCGPSASRQNEMRRQIAIAERSYLEAVRAIDDLDLVAASDAWDRLQLVRMSPDHDAVQLVVDGRTAIQTAESMERALRQEIEQRLPELRSAYLESRFSLGRLDALMRQMHWPAWESRRAEWQKSARQQASEQLRLVIEGDPLPDAMRDALASSLLAQAEGALHTGYDLADPPRGLGDLVATAEAEWLIWRTSDGQTLGQVPTRYSIELRFPETVESAWGEQRFVTPRVPEEQRPDLLVYEDRTAAYAAIQAFREEAVALMSDQLRRWVGEEWPPLALELADPRK